MQENAPYVIICYLDVRGKELKDIKMIYIASPNSTCSGSYVEH